MSTGSSRPTIGGLLMVVGLLIISSLIVVSCGSGGSSSNGPAACDTTDERGDACDADIDGDMVMNADDVDDDNDGLVEIYDSAMLWALHCDPDGTSYTAPMTNADGAIMFNADGYPQCGTASRNGALATKTPADTTDCTAETADGSGIYLCGYELGGDIAFPANWKSLRDRDMSNSEGEGSFSGIFEGNGYELSNLAYVSISTDTDDGTPAPGGGLFDSVELSNTIIRNLAIRGTLTAGGVNMTGATGGIAGSLAGTLIAVSSSATLRDRNIATGSAAGGLVGVLSGAIYSSFASGMITAADKTTNSRPGGLVGSVFGSDATMTNSYVGGSVQGSPHAPDAVGGLSGLGGPRTTNSYVSAAVDSGNGGDNVGAVVGALNPGVMNSYYDDAKVTAAPVDTKSNVGTAVSDAQLRGCDESSTPLTDSSVTECANLYVGWSDTIWDFGTSTQLPALKYAQITAVAGSDCSDTTGVDAAVLAANFRPNAIAQPYCGKLQRGQGR